MSPGKVTHQKLLWMHGTAGDAGNVHRRGMDLGMDARAGCAAEKLPHGAHMEIGTYGDLATLRWAPSRPWAPDLLTCSVSYGARSSASLPLPTLGGNQLHYCPLIRLYVPPVGPSCCSPSLVTPHRAFYCSVQRLLSQTRVIFLG